MRRACAISPRPAPAGQKSRWAARAAGIAWLLAIWSFSCRDAAPAGLLSRASASAAAPTGKPAATAPPSLPAAAAPAAGGAPSLPGADVVLITIDTLRADAVGFAGNRRAATPVLDRLAAAGRVFPNAHAQNVVTLPSHTNILTGLYPFQHGVRDNSGFKLAATVPTLATLLHGAGYATGAFVAAFPLDSRFGLAHGFDVYDDHFPRGAHLDEFLMAERRGDQVVRLARAWWQKQRGHRRFLWVHLYDAHAPYQSPEPFASRFKSDPYLGAVAAVDSYLAPLVGPFLTGKEPPALVIVTADHGEGLGDHGELTHGLLAYEATLKVPLVLWWPGAVPGRDPASARHVDILPTVLAALHLAAPGGLPGRSLLQPTAAPPAARPAVDAGAGGISYFEALSASLNRGWAPLRGVVRGRYKLIDLPLPELYDLAADPREEHNLISTQRPLARELAAAIPAAARSQPQQGAVTAEEAARLRSLGYSAGGGHGAAPGRAMTADDDPKRLIQLDYQLHQVIDLYSRGQYAQAAALARQAIAARPAMGDAYELLAISLRQQERGDQAIAVLQEARAKGVRSDSLDRQLGEALAEAGRSQEAVAVLRPLAAGGDDPAALQDLGMALSDAGHQDEAAATLEKATRLFPEDPRGFEDLGVIALRRGQAAAARDHLRHALAMNAGLASCWNTLGVALYQLHQPADALDAWHRAAGLDATQYDALYNLGLVAAELGRSGEAREALSRFIATAPRERFADEIAKAQARLQGLGG